MDLLSDNKIILGYCKTIIKFCSTENCINLKKNNYALYRTNLIEKFEDFFQKYPSLFNMIIDNPTTFEIEKLINMLNMKEKIDNNEITSESASVQVGQEYYDEYVKEKVDKL